jgi:hypothetical protein
MQGIPSVNDVVTSITGACNGITLAQIQGAQSFLTTGQPVILQSNLPSGSSHGGSPANSVSDGSLFQYQAVYQLASKTHWF